MVKLFFLGLVALGVVLTLVGLKSRHHQSTSAEDTIKSFILGNLRSVGELNREEFESLYQMNLFQLYKFLTQNEYLNAQTMQSLHLTNA